MRQTERKRLHAKLKAVKAELRRHRHAPVPDVGRWLGSVVRGHYRYYAVPENYRALSAFHYQLGGLWRRELARRSQRGHVNWPRMRRLINRWLPPPRILHPYPNQRRRVMTQGRSPVR